MSARHGSCLCGDVTFVVNADIQGIGVCHCSKCRKASGGIGNVIFIVPSRSFAWLSDNAPTVTYQQSGGYGVTRCKNCGSPLPVSLDGKQMWINAGLMDDPLETKIMRHIFVDSMPDWDRIPDDEECFAEYPPAHPGR